MFRVIVTRKLKGQQSLHQPGCRLRSPAVIKRIAIPAVLFLAITFLMSACVSHDDDVSERSGLQSAALVPGEKIPDQGAYAPGPPGSSGSVRW
jgi:hypothetical protein